MLVHSLQRQVLMERFYLHTHINFELYLKISDTKMPGWEKNLFRQNIWQNKLTFELYQAIA